MESKRTNGVDDEPRRSPEELSAAETAAAKGPLESASGTDVERADREVTFTRQALIRGGWAVPLVLAAGVSKVAFAGINSRDGTKVHIDVSGPPHIDTTT
jgi:hypothetical protein